MLLRFALLLSLASALILSSCAPEQSQIVLAKFGNQEIKMKQFENAYKKNVGGIEKSKEDSLASLKKFLNLYVDYKMKLRNALVRGLDQDSALQNELNGYEKQVGVTYLLEKDIINPGIHQLYNRRKWELRVSHIMIRPDSSGYEHAKILAQALLDSIKHGANFAKLAKKYSQDYYSKNLGGDIYYVTAGELPPSFEDAAYNTPVGQVYPHIVKTKYGYHIIKVTEKRKRVPEIRVSHILAKFINKEGKLDSTAARIRIDSAMAELKRGVNFAKVAEKYSQDLNSAKYGGDIGFIARRMMVKPFDEAAFNLKKVGDITGIIRTRFGYHIIKLTAKKPYPSFQQARANLIKILKRTRYRMEYDSLIARLKREYNYKLNNNTFHKLASVTDTLKFGEIGSALKSLNKKPLFTYAGKTVDIGELLNEAKSKFRYANTPKLLRDVIDKISNNNLLAEKAMNLDKTDPKFAALMNEYKNGIYIFKLQQDEVWNKLKVDSAKLYAYYLKNKNKYVWPNRVDFNEIFEISGATANALYDSLKNGFNFNKLAAKYTERIGYRIKKGSYGLKSVNFSILSEKANGLQKPGEFSKPFKTRGGYSIVQLVKKDPSHLKTFEEAKPEVSSFFQDAESKRLENAYIERLKEIYHPIIYYNRLEEAF